MHIDRLRKIHLAQSGSKPIIIIFVGYAMFYPTYESCMVYLTSSFLRVLSVFVVNQFLCFVVF